MTYLSIGEVLDLLPSDVNVTHQVWEVEQGMLQVAIIKMPSGVYDVWNKHPLRKGWQLVYTLEKCNPEQQAKESLASLKRLFEEDVWD